MARFSIKDLAQWLYNTACEYVNNPKLFEDGVVYYRDLGNGVTAVLCWSDHDDYAYEFPNPFMRPTMKGFEFTGAYCLECSLHETRPLSEWGDLPCDWPYWDSHMPGAEEFGCEGAFSLSQSDWDDKMRTMAKALSARRTQFRKYYKT